MRASYLIDRAEAREAGPKGWGVFAVASIPAGTTVAGFGGSICDRAELDTLTALNQRILHHLAKVGGGA